jgi:PilZ domain
MTVSTTDNRHNLRAIVSISCAFGPTEDTPRSANLTSLSTRGCFVKTRAWAETGMEMYVKIWLPTQDWLTLRATVLYHMEKIGFGLRFDAVTPEEERVLISLIEDARRSPRPPDEGAGTDDD